MNRQQDDLYIKILTYGKTNIGQPVKYSELKKSLDDESYEYDEFALEQFFSQLFINKLSPHGNDPSQPPPPNGEYFLEHSGYFHLMEHEELLAARKSSFYATIFASIAIVISIFSTCVSIYFANKQLNKPTQDEVKNIETAVVEIKSHIKKIPLGENAGRGKPKENID